MVTGKWATLLLVLVVVFTAGNGEVESEATSKLVRSSGSVSQDRLTRFLVRRKLRQGDSGNTQEMLDQFSAKMGSFQQEFKATTEIPVQQQDDLVHSLPGQPKVDFAQYAGYVTVNETAGRALFYYFAEATNSSDTKPLVLWLTGGPGCSSLGAGAFMELGPFGVNSDGSTLYINEYAWNQQANMLFLESPAGVGFSYSNDTNDYTSNGDARTASDSLIFLLNWIERFPQYKYRDFYITGESYGGHYVPELAKLLYEYNKGQTNASIPLKGFMVGNGVIDDQRDGQGLADYMYTHALISNETYVPLQQCLQSANFNQCNFTDAYDEAGNIDPYDIYGPLCNKSGNLLQSAKSGEATDSFDPCSQNYVTSYLNLQDVQKALHANVTALSYPWALCNDEVGESWQDSASTVIPHYQELISAGLHIYVYSGDVDSVLPVTCTKYSLALLNLKTIDPWFAWYSDGEVGGYTEGYKGLTFVTVRGAGHQVPMYQPDRALTMFTSYINYLPLPSLG